jgi:hypothetical protein
LFFNYEKTDEYINTIVMRYNELKEAYFPEKDAYHRADIGTSRKTRLTLKHLNELRKVREIRKQDQEQNREFVSKMYGQPTDLVQ